jgi:hypothetical protein
MVMVAVAIPVVLALVPSSTPHPDPPPQGGREIFAKGGREISAPTLPSPRGGGTIASLGRRVIEVNGVPVSVPAVTLPAIPVEGATPTVNNAIKMLERTTRSLTRNLGTTPGVEPPTLPIKVGGL